MPTLLLHILNVFFFVLHTGVILFNVFAWMFPKTQRLHFISLMLVLFSWLGLGFWKGFGYCFLTDWHYQVLRALGKTDLPSSYIVFLIKSLSGWQAGAQLVDIATAAVTGALLVCSVYVNFLKRK